MLETITETATVSHRLRRVRGANRVYLACRAMKPSEARALGHMTQGNGPVTCPGCAEILDREGREALQEAMDDAFENRHGFNDW